MKMISTVAILIGTVNISILSTILYNYGKWPPIGFCILSLAYIAVILLTEYEFRRFRILQPGSIQETAYIFDKYLWLFAVGCIIVGLKWTVFQKDPFYFQSYILVECLEQSYNTYFNLLYYGANYLLGKLYLYMFLDLYSKFKHRVTEGLECIAAPEDTECSVCLLAIHPSAKCSQTPCSHLFHVSCLRRWLLVRRICPVCSSQIGQFSAAPLL